MILSIMGNGGLMGLSQNGAWLGNGFVTEWGFVG